MRRLTPEAKALLQAYAWPGNVRELRNVLERVYVETSTEFIGRRAFDEWVAERARFTPGGWDMQARHEAQAARAALITPLPNEPALDPDRGMAALPLLLPPARPDDGLPPLDLPQPLTAERLKHAYRRAGGNITQGGAAARGAQGHPVTGT